MTYSKPFLTLLFSVVAIYVCAQIPPQVSDEIKRLSPKPVPLSPNAASLGKFGDYPVGYFTGLPDISIPLAEAKSGTLSVPITLSYHASGIRYTEQASWVGLGWSLSASGQISRQVLGKSDEEYFYNNPIPTSLSSCTDFDKVKDISTGAIDTEPDIFSYSLPFKSGKFMLGQAVAGQPHIPYLIPYAPLVIKETYESNNFSKFEITDERGVLHRFGKNLTDEGQPLETAYETTFSESGNGQSSYRTAWRLIDMAAPNADDKIKFSYQELGRTTMQDVTHNITVLDAYQCDDGSQTENPSNPCPTATVLPFKATTINTFAYPTDVKSISFEGGRIDFVLASTFREDQPESKNLDRINVYSILNGVSKLEKSIKFIYSYFFSSQCTGCKLLKLDELQINDGLGASVQRYRFTYYSSQLTRASQTARDYWDFYNGKTGNENLIPKQNIVLQTSSTSFGNYQIGGADRSTNPAYLTEGVLQRIEYPTSGFTEFEYEPHKFRDPDDGIIKYAGGLRVLSITSVADAFSKPMKRTYRYGENEDGLGKKNFVLLPGFYNSEQITRKIQTAPFKNDQNRTRTYFSSSALSLESSEGSPVIYPVVTEYIGDEYSNSGKTIYEFDLKNPPLDGRRVVPRTTKNYKDVMSWARGKLTKKIVRDQQGKIVATTDISYVSYHNETRTIGYGAGQYIMYVLDRRNFLSPCNTSLGIEVDGLEYSVAPYSQTSGIKLEGSVTERLYSDPATNKYVETITTSTYDPDFLQVTQKVQRRSGSTEETVTTYKYPFNIPTGSASGLVQVGTTQAITALKTANVLTTPIEEVTTLRSISGAQERVISAKLTTFRSNEAFFSFTVPDQIFLLETNAVVPIANFSFTKIASGLMADPLYKARVKYKYYDSNSNLKELNIIDDKATAYIWGYSNTVPIAEVQNTSVKNVFHTSFEEDASNVSTTSSRTGKQSRLSGYQLSLSNLDNGNYRLTYFEFIGGAWKLNEEQISVTSGTFLKTFSNQIDELRFYPAAAQMNTFTYELQKGTTSATDDNNRTTYYKYDDFGRLNATFDDNGHLLKSFKYNYFKQVP